LEYIRGRDEVHVTEYGLVRVLHVKINASTKALTVEELAGRRKTVVVGFLDTILNDISRDMDAAVDKENFRARLAVDCQSSALQGLQNLLQKELFARHNRSDFLTTDWKPAFIQSIKDESAARAKVYKDKDSTWFASNAHLAKSVSDGLALSTLAKAKYTLWLRDTTLGLYDMACLSNRVLYHNFQRSYGKLLARQRKELKEAEVEAAEVEEAHEDKHAAAIQRLKELALEECTSRRWITSEEQLEDKDETTSFTPLLTYSHLGEVEVAKRLLQARADTEAVDREGKTALMCAVKEGNMEMALLLINYKANLEATLTDENCMTPLMMAGIQGNVDLVRVLIEKGANLEAVTEAPSDKVEAMQGPSPGNNTSARGGQTPLMLASIGGHVEAIRLLIEKGANVEAADKSGMTPLILASFTGHVQAIRMLIEKGANLEAVDENCMTPLMYASVSGHADALRVLIENGANVEAPDSSGKTPLQNAKRQGHNEVVSLLKEHGAEETDENDRLRVLLASVRYGNPDALRILAELLKGMDDDDSEEGEQARRCDEQDEQDEQAQQAQQAQQAAADGEQDRDSSSEKEDKCDKCGIVMEEGTTDTAKCAGVVSWPFVTAYPRYVG
jgi:ankyrin repeat protein